MLLQISPSDTIKSVHSSGLDQSDVLWAAIFLLLIGSLLLVYFLFRSSDNEAKSKTHSNSEKKKVYPVSVSSQKEATKVVPDKISISTSARPLREKMPATEQEAPPNLPVNEKQIPPEPEEQNKVKNIGYNPVNVFVQTEPLHYPYVLMPKPNSVIKFPGKGRAGRKGYTEEEFKTYLHKYFKSSFQIFDDRYVLVKNGNQYEPDFSLINERNGKNLFIDIEIDEPYEGINEISKRRVSHYQYLDTDRNKAFVNRGWIVIRFAEIQVHQTPDSCCRFVADVVKSLFSNYKIPESLHSIHPVEPLRQWTKEQAQIWSEQRYREKYLSISSFGYIENSAFPETISETELGKEIEEQVTDEPTFTPPHIQNIKSSGSKAEILNSALVSNKYLSFIYRGKPTIVKPLKINTDTLTAFCFVKNSECSYPVYEITQLVIKDNYYTMKVSGAAAGVGGITSAVKTAINYNKFIRMKYTRTAWTNSFFHPETGDLVVDETEAEESIRTISNVKLAVGALASDKIAAYNLNNNHITAYCNRREAERVFRFDRIGEIEILDVQKAEPIRDSSF